MHARIRYNFIAICVLGLTCSITAAQHIAPRENAARGHLQPRIALTSPAQLDQPAGPHKLVIKFRDTAQLRVDNTEVRSLTNADTNDLSNLLAQHNAQLEPLFKLPAQTLANIEQRAAQRSGSAQPDLAGLMRIRGADDQQLAPLARALRNLDIVEYVQFVAVQVPPPCDDIAPATPPYRNQQGYLTRNPGLHADCAQLIAGASGTGITIADVEYGLQHTHEDLCDVILEPGQTIAQGVFNNGWHHHGTAVAGIITALDNNFGCTGIVPDAMYRFFSEWTAQDGFRREDAFAAAINALSPGDVILLEMQAFGPNDVFVPAEYELAMWTLTRTAVDSGIIVVAAAGNGNQNLDSAVHAQYMARGDSGAILIGAGTADTNHARLSFSNFGSRVDVQGWGAAVFTLGYGNFAQHGNDPNQVYSHNFNGTSSASAVVAASVVALQSISLNNFNTLLTPSQMRGLLIATGRPQGGNLIAHIGPFPNLGSAALALGIDSPDCGGNGNPNICRIDLYNAADVNDNGVPDNCDRRGDLDGNGATNVFDLLMLLRQWGSCAADCDTACSADLLVPDCIVNELDLAELLANWSF